ncbi:MAG: response regulator transcription factor [Armatimonadota bacterium]|nr:response regulator transcription factor [Armatimonadota bacterium]MDR5703733.1 response regulator transcription factor [Armatimonadota bacterium]
MIRLLIVDDHPIVREGLIAVLEGRDVFEVVGEASTGEEAVRLSRQERPDIVLLDLELPGIGGVEVVGKILEASPSTKIIIFTAYDTDERIFGALGAGAKGYLLKGALGEEIARAIRLVHEGGSILEPRVAAKVLARVSPQKRSSLELSQREREVLRLVAKGLSNKEIARALKITERTVKFHVTSIFNKLGAGNRAQAVALASQRGLL